MDMGLIYVVEDDRDISEIESFALKNSGYDVQVYENGADFYRAVRERVPCLVLLDIMLPGLDGYQVFERTLGTPVIFLTAKSELTDKLKGLAMGADDYLTKPFQMLELAARVEAVLRRTKKVETEFTLGGMKCDFDRHQVFLNGTAIECTPKSSRAAARYLLYFFSISQSSINPRKKAIRIPARNALKK